MKLTIDTVEKTIVLEEDVTIKELISYLSDEEYETYTIKRTKEYVVYPTIPVLPLLSTYGDKWTITC